MGTLLLGDDAVHDTFESGVGAGRHDAFQYTAAASGTVDTIAIRLTNILGESSFTSLELGIYSDTADAPDTLLGSGTFSGSYADGDIVSVTGLSIPVVAGTKYWLTLLPVGGTISYDIDAHSGGTPEVYSSAGYPSLQASWPGTAATFADGPNTFWAVEGGLGAPTPDPTGGLEWHVTGLWYPDATSVDFYGQIADPIDGEVVIPLNDSRTASVTVSAWDPIVTDIVGHAYARCLKVYYRAELVFWGPYKLGDVKEDDDGNPVVTLSAVDPSLRMVQHFIRRGDVLSSGTLGASNGDKGTLSIDHLGIRLARDAATNIPEQTTRGCPDLGVINGTNDFVAAPTDLMGVTRGDEVWNTIAELSQSLGPDFELEPIEGTAGAYAQLNTFITQGTDKTDSVKLHYATGLNNLAKLAFTEGSKYVTHVHVLDREKKYRFTELNLAASAETGQYTMWVVTDFDSTGIPAADVETVLRNYGRDIIKAYSHPLTVVQGTLPVESEADGEYHYLEHFDNGDIIEVAGLLGRIALAAGGHRITQVRLAQSGPENGVAPELTLVPSVALTVDDTDTEG